ncbi:hypothetical protein [Streptobacillus canis]|uniref:hypothetical protein n=1 Tax=Streptobacillus canis TaxID=2678686 RepID=UPI0012E0CE3B|nr:hypothetical protein [Streptobacillus canis]
MKCVVLRINNITFENIYIYDFKSKCKFNSHNEDIVIFSCDKEYEEKLNIILESDEITYEIVGLENKEMKGLIKELLIEPLNDSTIVVRLCGVDESIRLSLNKGLVRLYQDTRLPVKQVIEDVLKDYGFNYHISKNINMEIGRVYYQFNEDDWSFLVRVLSDFNERIFINREGIIVFGEEQLFEVEEIA